MSGYMNRKSLFVFIAFLAILTSYFKCSARALQIVNKCCEHDKFLSIDQGGCVKNMEGFQSKSTKDLLEMWTNELRSERRNRTIPGVLGEDNFGPPQCLREEQLVIKNVHDLVEVSETKVGFLEEVSKSDNLTRKVSVSSDRICIDRNINGSELLVWACLPQCDGFDTFCLRKCCDLNEYIDGDLFTCQSRKDSGEDFNRVSNKHDLASLSFATHFGQPSCSNGRDTYEIEFETDLYNKLEILPSGNLFVETKDGEPEVIPWTEFCLEKISSSHPPQSSSTSDKIEMNLIALVCYPAKDSEGNDPEDPLNSFRQLLYPSLFCISAFFLLITSIIYVILWKDLNLPGWLQFSYVNSLLLSFSLLAILQFWSHLIFDSSRTLCKLLGYTLHGTFLSSFFWLTSMNIDLWCSFKHTPIITSFGRSRAKRRYVAFGFFSTVIPLGVTLLTVLIDDYSREYMKNQLMFPNSPEISKPSFQFHMISTGIGRESCALSVTNKLAMLFSFYGVVGLLLIINLMFFFCTVLCLRERQRETKFAHRQSTAASNNCDPEFQRFKLFTRLFFIMGVLWIFELISWITSTFLSPNKWILLQRFFVITDSLNALQGLAIFCIFIWKPQTWKQLKKRFWSKAHHSISSYHRHPFLSYQSQTTNKSRLSSTSTKSSSIVSKHNIVT